MSTVALTELNATILLALAKANARGQALHGARIQPSLP
jgi:hypothetical protein